MGNCLVVPAGGLSTDVLSDMIRPDTFLVSLIWANNKTRVIWPVAKFAEICAAAGVLLHTDAVHIV